jgi:hypothetical protein
MSSTRALRRYSTYDYRQQGIAHFGALYNFWNADYSAQDDNYRRTPAAAELLAHPTAVIESSRFALYIQR